MGSSLYLRQIEVGPMANFVYFVGDTKTRECFVVDPGWDAHSILKIAEKEGMKVVGVLITHTHYDHVNALETLAAKVNGKVYVHHSEAEFLKGVKGVLEKTEDGSLIQIGSIRIRCLHTPGHTTGGQCFLVSEDGDTKAPMHLLSGDTLFVGACGRCDLPESDPRKMYESLKKIAGLPDETVLLSGHHYGELPTSTVGKEKKSNPYYQCSSLSEFLHDRMGL